MPRSFPRILILCLFALAILLPTAAVTLAQDIGSSTTSPAPVKKKRFGDSRDRVELSITASSNTAKPGDRLVIAIALDHQPGWHSHTNDPNVPAVLGDPDSFIKTQLKLDPKAVGLSEAGVASGAPLRAYMSLIQWPAVHETDLKFGNAIVKYGVFDKRSVIFVPIAIDPKAADGEYDAAFLLTFQSCDERACIAPAMNVKLGTKIKVAAGNASAGSVKKEGDFAGFDDTVFSRLDSSGKSVPPSPHPSGSSPSRKNADGPVTFAFFGYGFSVDPSGLVGGVVMLLLAMLGGFLLNFTPCVLPVIPIKMMSLSRAAGDRIRCLWLGSVMSLGVVLFWLGLGTAIALTAKIITAAGKSGGVTSANELFQHPPFTIAVGIVICIMAVGMCGLFAVRLPQFVYAYSPKLDSAIGALGMGVMTAILSTPCTAPFMGTAAAWAVGLGSLRTLSIFVAIGVGMALPYFLLSAFPAVASRMPRTGPASELTKQIMGLLMLAAGAYFIGTGISGALVAPPDPPTRIYWWFVAGIVIIASVWLVAGAIRTTRSFALRTLWTVVGVAMGVGASQVAILATDHGPIAWVYYTSDRMKTSLAAGNIVVMDFTAEWCLNCKVLEKAVLDSPRISTLLRSDGVVPMKVDLTGNNEAGNAKLGEVDSLTIPLLVVFDRHGNIVFKSDAYTEDQVADAVKEALGK